MFNPCHPGEILREDYLVPLELSVTEVAEALGVARQSLSALINKRSGISAEMAIRLSKAFGTTPELWVDLQKQYDLWFAKQHADSLKVRVLV